MQSILLSFAIPVPERVQRDGTFNSDRRAWRIAEAERRGAGAPRSGHSTARNSDPWPSRERHAIKCHHVPKILQAIAHAG